jgi:hypothetical protein
LNGAFVCRFCSIRKVSNVRFRDRLENRDFRERVDFRLRREAAAFRAFFARVAVAFLAA